MPSIARARSATRVAAHGFTHRGYAAATSPARIAREPPMRRPVIVLSLLLALAVGALSGYWLGVRSERAREAGPGVTHAATPHAGVADSGTSPSAGRARASSDAPATADVLRDGAVAVDAPTAAPRVAGDLQPPSSAKSARGLATAGPRPLSAAGERRIADVIAGVRLHNTDFDDRYTLLEHDAREAVSADAAEAQLAAFLHEYGAGYNGLELAPLRCSDTVCTITATALPGLGTDAPHANAQALFARLMADPRFQAAFSDPAMMVTSRDGAVVYVATFLRTLPAG
ncbi:hypothetical protein ACF3M1_02615 [Luteimonas sp. WGS1318]|uniref:hypothetical protein n=1 Tax=Luteimonas sp. WGS1318 TaxID=3366815 RepID=UPI00372D6F01